MNLFDKNIKPMLLSEIDKTFNDKNYLYEIKFDGIRALIYVDKNDIVIKSRNGKVLNNLYPELLDIKNITDKKCIFDGEIVLMVDGKPTFSKLLERNRVKSKNKILFYMDNYPVTFVCFDILYENKNLIDLTLIERKKVLFKYKDTDCFIKSRVFDNGIELFKIVKKNNLEGIVAKLKLSKYIPNIRSKEWIKIKNLKDEDYYVCGYKIEKNVAIILLGEKVGEKFKFVSKVLLGKKKYDFKLISECNKVKNNFIDFDDLEYIYVEPKYKCTITFLEKTKNNHLRHPVFKFIKLD